MFKALSIFFVCLVSSHAMKDTFASKFVLLEEMSFKLPMGVPTTYNTLDSGSSPRIDDNFSSDSIIK